MKETASKGTSPGVWETWQQDHIQTLQQQLLLQGECLIRNQTQESILVQVPDQARIWATDLFGQVPAATEPSS